MNKKIYLTKTRRQISKLDELPTFDRSLIDYSKYNNTIGHAWVKYSMAVQATRGCPYRCFYCDVYKTTKHHFRRSVENIFEEVKLIASMGIKRIEFIDDIFSIFEDKTIIFISHKVSALRKCNKIFDLKTNLFVKSEI